MSRIRRIDEPSQRVHRGPVLAALEPPGLRVPTARCRRLRPRMRWHTEPTLPIHGRPDREGCDDPRPAHCTAGRWQRAGEDVARHDDAQQVRRRNGLSQSAGAWPFSASSPVASYA